MSPDGPKTSRAGVAAGPVLLSNLHRQGSTPSLLFPGAEVALDPERIRDLLALRRAEQRDRRLRSLCAAPDPFASLGEARRAAFLDIPDLDTISLWQELRRAELRLALEVRPIAWLVARARACRSELTARTGCPR